MESVSSIHKRWSFTRLNPTSTRTSLLISIINTAVLIFTVKVWIFKQPDDLLPTLVVGSPAMCGLTLLDFCALRKTPLNKLSKVFHVSAFSSLFWSGTVMLGLALHILSARTDSQLSYVIEGMFLAIGLRVAIFRSVFGARLPRSIFVGIIQPIILAAVVIIVPFSSYTVKYQLDLSPSFGMTFVGISILWTLLAERAGRPSVASTFDLLQAFLVAWTDNDAGRMGMFTESRSEPKTVKTLIARFKDDRGGAVNVILPDIHPGPFNPVGEATFLRCCLQHFQEGQSFSIAYPTTL